MAQDIEKPKEPIKEKLRPNMIKSGWSFRAMDQSRLYQGMKVKTREDTKSGFSRLATRVATAAETIMRGPQGQAVQPLRKINLINFIQDPFDDSDKGILEAAARRNMYVRIALKIREQAAFKKQKLVVDLPEELKDEIDDEEKIKEKVKAIQEKDWVKSLLRKFRTRDKNVGMEEKLKVLGNQCWIFGRNLLIITFQDDNENEIKNLLTINSRRLGDPILDAENDMSFEGCYIDSEPLIKDSMIYATYNEREFSPHTAHFGYPPLETVMHIAETHNIITEEDMKETAKSAWLPTILVPIDTSDLGDAQKSARLQTVINGINPGKVLGYPSDLIPEQIQAIDLQPKSNWLDEMTDSLEMKILNAFHIPLFHGKTDKIANRDTAMTSAQLFIDGIVADDQEWMEKLLLKQWYEPLLREELKTRNSLSTDTENPQEVGEEVDLETPEGDDAPLPFVIKRTFEKMRVEQLVDMVDALVNLKTNNIWDTQKINEVLETPEVTARVIAEEEKKKKEQMEMMKSGKLPDGQKPPNQAKPPNQQPKPDDKPA